MIMIDNKRKELLPKAKPILFNTEMVRAILDGRKTVTRRIMKKPPPDVPTAQFRTLRDGKAIFEWDCSTNLCERKTPYYPNDILYVRETWCKLTDWKDQYPDDEEDMLITYYRADYSDDMAELATWHPSIHMPKEATRIFLRVTNVRVERLQDITHSEIAKEGVVTKGSLGSPERINPYFAFKNLWDSTIKKSDLDKYGWNANPWVWVIKFEKVD